jgi:hypothetical protein
MMRWETELSIPPHCFLFDASLFKVHGIVFDESLPTHEDWECWMSIFALTPGVFHIDKPLADYRLRSNSMCANKLKMRKGYLQAIRKQMTKHRSRSDVVEMLNRRKREIKYYYRDLGLVMRLLERCPHFVKKIYCDIVPWRVQRFLD